MPDWAGKGYRNINMRRVRGALAVWLAIAVGYLLSLYFLPASKPDLFAFASYTVQTLLFILCIKIVRHEPTWRNRLIFINFSVFFGLSVAAHLYNFVGTLIPASWFIDDPRYASLVFDEYFRGAYFLLLAFSVVYLTIDVLFRHTKGLHKYLLTGSLVGSFFVSYFSPFLADPLYLHRTDDVLDWKALDETARVYEGENGREATIDDLSKCVAYPSLEGSATAVSSLVQMTKARTEYLYPYLNGMNWQILVYKPLHLYQILMSVVCVGFILLFFGYLYLKDPPQGAYIEKVMFLLLLFCTLEILHGWISIESLQWQAFFEIFTVGQVISNLVLLLMSFFFGLRLLFITSVNGEFYEQELLERPSGITRWRDTLDNILIEKFFNRKVLLGRMLVDPTRNK
jgi:hypothetical protein